jgi:hypothetical protein
MAPGGHGKPAASLFNQDVHIPTYRAEARMTPARGDLVIIVRRSTASDSP